MELSYPSYSNSHSLAGDKLVLDAINKYYSSPEEKEEAAAYS